MHRLSIFRTNIGALVGAVFAAAAASMRPLKPSPHMLDGGRLPENRAAKHRTSTNSVRRDQRRAKKARNVARNRRNHRG